MKYMKSGCTCAYSWPIRYVFLVANVTFASYHIYKLSDVPINVANCNCLRQVNEVNWRR